jgi:hypothetical protein
LSSPSTLAGEWARPTISEVAGDEPSSTSQVDQIDRTEKVSPLPSLPKINAEPSVKARAAEINTALRDSAQSNDHTNAPQGTADPNRILQPGHDENSRWIDGVLEHGQNWATTMRRPNSASNGIALPASYLRFSPLDRKQLKKEPTDSPLREGSRTLKSSARSNASISDIFKSASNLEPLLVALLFDYVAARNFQQLTKKQSPEKVLAPKIAR